MSERNDGASLQVERSNVTPPSRSVSEITYRFSGHQTFPLRIAWIPKAVAAISRKQDPLTDIDQGITTLGLGKNMVEALRCWIEAFQVAGRSDGTWTLTTIGEMVFGPDKGLDPYLEDISTSWLLHWLITTNRNSPFFAWECLFNRWPTNELSASLVLEAFRKEASKAAKPVSEVTLRQHWEVFLHSYRPPRNSKGEDHLDSALSVLRLIREVGERPDPSGKWEPLYSFDTGRKSTLSREFFAFVLHDWWNRCFPQESTVPLREVVLGDHSPGRILKMNEAEVVQRLTDLANSSPEVFQIVESSNLRQLRRLQITDGLRDLRAGYRTPTYG